MRHTLIFIAVLLTACNQPLQERTIILTDTTNKIAEPVNKPENKDEFYFQTVPFPLIKDFPSISDTLQFIEALKQNCHLEDNDYSSFETINYFKKVSLFGSDKEYYIIEYDFHNGSSAAFPWKLQMLFDIEGKLIKLFSDIRIDLVKIFPKSNPFLIRVSATGKGNGWHEISKIDIDTIKNVYTGFLSNRPQTYDSHHDNTINEPYEFPYKIADINRDGFNDIIFSGKIVLIQGRTKNGEWYDYETRNGKHILYSENNPFKKIPASFIFLYNPRNEQFIEQENYAKKYAYLFGDYE